MKLLVALLAIAILHACAGEVGPAPVVSPAPAVHSASASVDGAMLAVVKLVRIDEEASNLGGTHFTFELDAPGEPRFVHGGGHGFALAAPDRRRPPRGFYIAEIVPSTQPFRIWDGGWGIGYLPAYVGTVRRAVAVTSHAEALRLLPGSLDCCDHRALVDFTARSE